jgi:hypothetical protein
MKHSGYDPDQLNIVKSQRDHEEAYLEASGGSNGFGSRDRQRDK